MLIKGLLLFLAIGLLFFLIIVGIEYFLWLNSTGRFVLLFAFVIVELYLLFRYILTPLFYLFKLKKGLSNKQASLIIGKHFSNVGDKLYNLLDLKDDTNESELLLASIEQRSASLSPISFTKAIDFKDNLKYVKYLAIPVIVLALLWLGGIWNSFFGSYERVMHYDLAFEPPAPFSFKLLTNDLNVLNDKPLTVHVTTEGNVKPASILITIEGQKLVLQDVNGIYQYTFLPPLKTTDFSFEADQVSSRPYRLNALRVPLIKNFQMILNYPRYINKPPETIKNTGSATFPEGTKVTWKIEGNHTESIDFVFKDTTILFKKDNNNFKFTKKIYDNLSYQLSTSNTNVSAYEKLSYEFTVIKDAYPSIKVKQVMDSLNPNILYYLGEASDDYKLNSIALVWYADDDIENKQILPLVSPNSNFKQFYYTFPTGLNLDTEKTYSYYFQAIDNDVIHNGKTSKSKVFSMSLFNQNELKNKTLESQHSLIKNLDRSLDKLEDQKQTLREINLEQKVKNQYNSNDKKKIKDFLMKQQQQENMMQKFSKELKQNLEKKNTDNHLNKLLRERLERQEIEAKKNQKLLEELNKIADKIEKDDLKKKLDELANKQKNSERSLEQLLELTKRYYVTEKAAQLAKDLEKLAEKQAAEVDNKEDDTKTKKQEQLSKAFDKISDELNELKKDNNGLQKPLDLNFSEKKQQSVKTDQQQAFEELSKDNQDPIDSNTIDESATKAKQKQKSAAKKMKEISDMLQQSSSGGSGTKISEDVEMLRQILDNLITFSFKQEYLFNNLKQTSSKNTQFSSSIKKQQELRGLFEHVDDSLFALSLRTPEISEFVNEQINEVFYNIDKSLENITDNKIYQGVSNQKYVLSASNNLADFLANILDNMQMIMKSGNGQGLSKGFQLPDIIKSQGEINEKMKNAGKNKGDEGQENGNSKGNKKGQNLQEGEGGEGESGEGDNTEGKSENGNSGDVKSGQGSSGDGNQESPNSSNNKLNEGGKGNNKVGNTLGDNHQYQREEELKEIYEIYKQQQFIRKQLEDQLQNMINNSDRNLGQKLVKQMKDFESDLIENGITPQGMSKLNTIQYELLKIENAVMKQGKKPERESKTNSNSYINPITTKPSLLENYHNDIEFLNRQALPLRHNYKKKVKDYFKGND